MFSNRLHAVLASAALLFFSGCVQSQAPIVDSSRELSREAPQSPTAAPAMRSGVEMLLGQVQALQEELMQLRGVVEEQGHQLEVLKQQSLERYIELDRRIGDGDGAIAQGGNAPVDSSIVAAGARADDAADGPVDQQPASTTAPQSVAPAQPSSTDSFQPSEMDAYRDAYNLVKQQNFVAAKQGFQSFLQAFSDSKLVPNAHYWLGELHLQSPQDLAKAEQAFGRVLKDFPEHAKAPDALYKLGRIEFMRGNAERAAELMQQVIDEYGASGSAAPQLAKQFLDQNPS